MNVIRASLMLITVLLSLNYLIYTSIPNRDASSSYTWTDLRTNTIEISYSYSKFTWVGDTGYLHIKANGPGTYSDTKTLNLLINVFVGCQASLYVCGDDRNNLPAGWSIIDKYLKLYVDGKVVYELGDTSWYAHCPSKAITLGSGLHTVSLKIHASVNVSANYGERDIAHALIGIGEEWSGTIQAASHSAEAILDGSANHFFTFKLPDISDVDKINWRARWRGSEKTGSGAPGTYQTVSFTGFNRDSWVFTSPVAIRIGESVPSIQSTEGYWINAVYDEGSQEVGVKRMMVALTNGDEVGFTSGKYLVTTIEYVGFDSTGCTFIEGSDAWANSGSSIQWAQKIRFHDASGWVTEEAKKGTEIGTCILKRVGGGSFSKGVSFSSKNRVDEIKLTIDLPEITIHFDSMRGEPVGPTDLGFHKVGETVEIKVKTLDCLGEYSRIDAYKVSETSPGIRSYTYSPLTGVYRGITSVIGGNVTFTVRWVSLKLVISAVSGAVLRDGVYWANSGSTVSVMVSVMFPDDGSPAKGVKIRDSKNREVLTNSNGAASFSYVENDCESCLSYVAVDEHGNRLSNEASVRIIFSRILVEIVNWDGILLRGTYYACNDAYSSLVLKTLYSHNRAPVSRAAVSFKPAGLSASTDSEGVAILKLVGRNRAYEGSIEVDDSVIYGSNNVRIVFTDVILEPSESTFCGLPGEEVDVNILARLTFNNIPLEGVKVRWVNGDIIKETPASFRLKIPKEGFLKARFEAIGFIPCVKPCEIILSSSAVKFGDPGDKAPTVIVNGLPSRKYSYDFMLNIMDLLNLTIPKVVWYGNGSIAYGVRIGVISLNGTVIRTGIVSEEGVSFNWTESKPGVYYYLLKPLSENIGGDILSIKAVFTAFNITGDYIFDLNDTHVFFATARWAHNNSPVESLPVHTAISKRRALSDDNGVVKILLRDSDYNASCIEKITVLRSDAHPSGIWRTVSECSLKIVKLDWSSLSITGDQYGLRVALNLTGLEYHFPISIMVEGYSPELYSSIRILHVKSDNSSMTIFIRPLENISFREMLALRIEDAEYDGANVRVKVRSLSNRLFIRNVKIKLLNSTLEKTIGDIPPGDCSETVLEIPDGLRTNPVVLVACSENTLPHIVKVWRREEFNLFALIFMIPLLVALVLRLRNKSKNSEESSMGKDSTVGDGSNTQ